MENVYLLAGHNKESLLVKAFNAYPSIVDIESFFEGLDTNDIANISQYLCGEKSSFVVEDFSYKVLRKAIVHNQEGNDLSNIKSLFVLIGHNKDENTFFVFSKKPTSEDIAKCFIDLDKSDKKNIEEYLAGASVDFVIDDMSYTLVEKEVSIATIDSCSRVIATYDNDTRVFSNEVLFNEDIDKVLSLFGCETYFDLEDSQVFLKLPNGESGVLKTEDTLSISEYGDAIGKIAKDLGCNVLSVEIQWGDYLAS